MRTFTMTLLGALVASAFAVAPAFAADEKPAATATAKSDKKLVVYTHRNEQLIKPLFDAYTKETGAPVEFLTGEPGPLFERIKAEGKGTEADIFLSVDAGSLWQANKEGLFEVVKSKKLNEAIPSNLRDPKGAWYGLSLRSRTIFFNKDKVKAEDLKSYADLADPKWKGKLCLRTSKKVYNQSLVAMLMAELGDKKTEQIVKGWVANLATDVFDNDTKLLEAIDKGDCQVGIANTYYLGRLAKEGKAKNVSVFFPPNTHMNVSGGGVLKNSDNKEAAVKFLEWLVTPQAQKMFADSNMEYPVVAGIDADPIVAAWGKPQPSKTPLVKAGELQRKATMLMERAQYK
jgi:iron(III) transport system substrate-binding protein